MERISLQERATPILVGLEQTLEPRAGRQARQQVGVVARQPAREGAEVAAGGQQTGYQSSPTHWHTVWLGCAWTWFFISSSTRRKDMTVKRRGLVLQGGGALGAYEYGVIKALYNHYPDFHLDVVSGVSIGAINAAVLVGAKKDPIRTLEEMWLEHFAIMDWPIVPQQLQSYFSSVLGIPGMCQIRPDFLLAPLMATSIYDTSPLRQTLAKLIDLDKLNSSPTHLVVTAVDIETGDLMSFKNGNQQEPFSLEMILASGSLAPNFPMTRTKDQQSGKEGWYWDGGLSSNLPLSQVINLLEAADAGNPDVERELIVVELFPMRAPLPTNMIEVQDRIRQLLFSSKMKLDRKLFDQINSFVDLIEQIDKDLPAGSKARQLPGFTTLMSHKKINSFIVITSTLAEPAAAGSNFSKAALERRIESGYQDACNKLNELGLIPT